MTNERKPEKAVDAFVQRVLEIRDMLGIIQEAADEHFGTHPDEVHWGHVGDANHVAGLLREIVTFIRNEEE